MLITLNELPVQLLRWLISYHIRADCAVVIRPRGRLWAQCGA